MTEQGAPDWSQVEVNGERFAWTLDDGMVHVRLPFRVNLSKLARELKQAGYFTSEDAEETGAQGWGSDYDAEGYYPYWVMPDDEDPEWTVFAYPPEDYDEFTAGDQQSADDGAYHPYLGDLARQELGRWLGQLKEARQG